MDHKPPIRCFTCGKPCGTLTSTPDPKNPTTSIAVCPACYRLHGTGKAAEVKE